MTRFDTPLTLTITNNMQNPPQNVSERYVNNLLRNGKNNLFQLGSIDRESMVIPESHEVVGQYYIAQLITPVGANFGTEGQFEIGFGATPSQAVRRALEKFGVTFK